MIFLLFTAIFLAVAFYYEGEYCFNTWINGIYCTGKTAEEVNAELLLQMKAPVITITDKAGNKEQIDLAECGYQEDFTESLYFLLEEQSTYGLPELLLHESYESVVPEIEIDEDLLLEKWEALSFVREELKIADGTVELKWTEEGFGLWDSMLGRLDIEQGYQSLLQAFWEGSTELSLMENGLYVDLSYTEEQKELLALWEKIECFQSCSIIFDMGAEQIALDHKVLGGFLQKNESGIPICGEDGLLIIDDEAVTSFITELLEEYNTYGKEREFLATRGDIVTVPAGTYGTQIDEKAEISYLTEALAQCVVCTNEPVREIHVPKYSQEAYYRGRNDIGDTYIEIDITEQRMYYYKEGECIVATDIVTGDLKKGRGTPSGTYYVYAKQTDRILRGPGYASFVNFWMPVYKGIGIHDASWKSEYGGEIYKTNGSRGCINTPKEYMTILYEQAEIGTPVLIIN